MTGNELVQRVADYLVTQLPLGGQVELLRRLEGGQSNPTYLLEAGGGRFVMRTRPPGKLLRSAHAIDREFRVLQALQGSDIPVPEPCLYCSDVGVAGTEFYLMRFVEGHNHRDPRLPGFDPARRAAAYESMSDVLAALACLDLAAVGLTDYGRREGFFSRQVRRWTEQYRACETNRREHVEALIDWLPQHLPADDGRAVLMHGDFRVDNLLFDDSGKVVAVLDWELSTLGHPLSDLAYQCAQWRLPAGSMRGLGDVDREALGIPSEESYVERFCGKIGLGVPQAWTFNLVLSLFRLASICQGVYRRGLDGNASGADALEFDRRTAVIAETAVTILGAAASDHVTLRRAR